MCRVRAEKEEELGALEQYWKERLGAQEEEHVLRQRLTDTQVGREASSPPPQHLFNPLLPPHLLLITCSFIVGTLLESPAITS